MSATDYEPDIDLVADLSGIDEGDRKRLLMIVNPYATTVSSRLKNLVISALRGSYIVDAVDTERRDHATEICREAAEEGYDAIVAFGGDGTVNEAANGLVGHRHAAHLPARRARQRLLPDARDPAGRRRRDRAPARLGQRLAYPRRSTSVASGSATSCSRPASVSTPASSSASTPIRD